MCGLSEGGPHLAQTTGGEKIRVWAMEEQVLLVWAMGGRAPLEWAKGIGGLSAMWCLLHDLQTVGTNDSSHLRNQRGAWPTTTRGL